MSMIEVKTAELIGPALRYAVAVACGWKMQRIEDGDWTEGEPHWWQAINEKAVIPGRRNGLVGYIVPGAKGITSSYAYCPDVDWSQGGPLIEKYAVKIEHFPSETIASKANARIAMHSTAYWQSGPTPLVALCRAIVAAKLGDVVSVPAELVQQPTEGSGNE